MDEEAVREYVDQSRSLVEASPQMDEQNTRSRLIDPFLKEVLGWDFYSTDVELEYSVQMGSSIKKVDYALLIEGSPAVFVEAKGCDTSLDRGHGAQLESYMQQEWVDWGLLTNGKRFKLFRLEKNASKPSSELLGETTLETLLENQWMVKALSKESIVSGDSDSIYRKVERRRRAVETLTERKDELSDSIRQLVVDEVGDVVSQPAETLSKELIDDLVKELEEGYTNREHPVPRSEPDGRYVVTIYADGESRSFTDGKQGKVMGIVTDYLIREHQLIENLPDFPYIPGKKRSILSDEPKHPTGEEMGLFEPVSDGYYVYTALSKESKMRYIKRFADFCDASVEFSGEW